jgi:hypothetical protein
LTIIPARNAPRAIEAPNNVAELTAMPSATARTDRVKSSRERVAATHPRHSGSQRFPTKKVIAIKRAIFADCATDRQKGGVDTLSSLAREGRNGNQDKNCENVFDHQPADCDMSGLGMERVVVG